MSRELNVGRIITFSGKKVEWPLWSEKFKARANRKGYKGILLGEDDCTVPEDDFDMGTVTDKEERERLNKLRRLNKEGTYILL